MKESELGLLRAVMVGFLVGVCRREKRKRPAILFGLAQRFYCIWPRPLLFVQVTACSTVTVYSVLRKYPSDLSFSDLIPQRLSMIHGKPLFHLFYNIRMIVFVCWWVSSNRLTASLGFDGIIAVALPTLFPAAVD